MAARYLLSPLPFSGSKRCEQVPVVRDQSEPDAGGDFLDQIRVACPFAQRVADLLDQMRVAPGVYFGPGRIVSGPAPVDQHLIVAHAVFRARPVRRSTWRSSGPAGHCRRCRTDGGRSRQLAGTDELVLELRRVKCGEIYAKTRRKDE